MISIRVWGRLGNQMFQYAFLRALQEQGFDNEINLSFKPIEERNDVEHGWENQLKYFKVCDFSTTDKLGLSVFQKIIKKINFLFLRRNRKNEETEQKYELSKVNALNKFGFFWLSQGYYNFQKTKYKNKEAIGYFESAKYFDNIKEKIQEEFVPKYDKLEKNKKLYDMIESTESVCVSIRRGDFLSDKYKDKFFLCSDDYYYKGIQYMKSKLHNPQFFVFSDDIEWCRKNMKFPKNTQFEDGTDPIWEKLRLMYSCKNFIIPNSTFSWWAQYLCRNENKIVVAPSRWRNNEVKLDIEQDDWIKIEV